MASLKEIKTRLASVKNTLKITSAMKMVASAKLRKAQSAIAGKLPYEQKLHHILAGMLQDDDLQKALHDSLGFGGSSNSPLELQDVPPDALPDRENVRRVAIVAFSSNSSLCGAFNSNVIKKFQTSTNISECCTKICSNSFIIFIGRKQNCVSIQKRINTTYCEHYEKRPQLRFRQDLTCFNCLMERRQAEQGPQRPDCPCCAP